MEQKLFLPISLLVVVFQASISRTLENPRRVFQSGAGSSDLNIFLAGDRSRRSYFGGELDFRRFFRVWVSNNVIQFNLTVWFIDLSSILLPQKYFSFFSVYHIKLHYFQCSIFSLMNLSFCRNFYPNNLSINILSFFIGTLWGALVNVVFRDILSSFKRWITL